MSGFASMAAPSATTSWPTIALVWPLVKDEGLIGEYGHPTEFELGTALAFLYFAELGVDLAIIEVGLGGRLDATNVIIPEVAVITKIAFDHASQLGTTLSAIAKEKAGIIKKAAPSSAGPGGRSKGGHRPRRPRAACAPPPGRL